MKNLLFLLVFTLCFSCSSNEEQPSNQEETGTPTTDSEMLELSPTGEPINRFEQAILNMEREDSLRTPKEGEVLFIGSSSIRFWKNLESDFDPIPVLNRGFGGSTLPEVIHYADRILFPYQSELIVLYCGENDISEGASPQQVLETFKKLDGMIRAKLPATKMIYISMKPSIARWNLWPGYAEGNELIKDYLAGSADRYFLDCSTVMLREDGTPDSTIFVEDMLHMNEVGYAGWKSLVRPEVERFLK